MDKNLQPAALFDSIRKLVLDAQKRVYQKVNSELIQLYWNIGRLIVEDEQEGSSRAAYGEEVLKKLSGNLMVEFGKGFDYTNLTNMRRFYMAFPIFDALRQELSWTHYRMLSKLENEKERQHYMDLAVLENWNTRELERNIRSGYVGRLLEVPGEGNKTNTRAYIKDPYIFEFLGIKPQETPRESTIEAALIEHLKSFLMELGKGFAFVHPYATFEPSMQKHWQSREGLPNQKVKQCLTNSD